MLYTLLLSLRSFLLDIRFKALERLILIFVTFFKTTQQSCHLLHISSFEVLVAF
jgi:hypothetical protein